jgi:hypothetical protein
MGLVPCAAHGMILLLLASCRFCQKLSVAGPQMRVASYRLRLWIVWATLVVGIVLVQVRRCSNHTSGCGCGWCISPVVGCDQAPSISFVLRGPVSAAPQFVEVVRQPSGLPCIFTSLLLICQSALAALKGRSRDTDATNNLHSSHMCRRVCDCQMSPAASGIAVIWRSSNAWPAYHG